MDYKDRSNTNSPSYRSSLDRSSQVPYSPHGPTEKRRSRRKMSYSCAAIFIGILLIFWTILAIWYVAEQSSCPATLQPSLQPSPQPSPQPSSQPSSQPSPQPTSPQFTKRINFNPSSVESDVSGVGVKQIIKKWLQDHALWVFLIGLPYLWEKLTIGIIIIILAGCCVFCGSCLGPPFGLCILGCGVCMGLIGVAMICLLIWAEWP